MKTLEKFMINPSLLKHSQDSLVSVIVPVFNAELYLSACLESIVAQTYKNLEIICVDDCSNDSSLLLLEVFAQKDPRIKILHHSHNLGVSAARNTALDHAHGCFISFCDADDEMSPYMIETLVQKLNTSDSDLGICGFCILGADGKFCEKHHFSNELLSLNARNDSNTLIRNVFTITPAPWCKMIKKEEGAKFSLTDLRFDTEQNHGEDLLWTIEALLKARNLCIIDEPLYRYKERKGSLTFSSRGLKDSQRLFIKIRDLLKRLECFEQLRFEFEMDFYRRNMLLLEHASPKDSKQLAFMILESMSNLGIKNSPSNKIVKSFFRLLYRIARIFVDGGGKLGKTYALIKNHDFLLKKINGISVHQNQILPKE